MLKFFCLFISIISLVHPQKENYKKVFVKEGRLSVNIPFLWNFKDGKLKNEKGHIVGVLSPGFMDQCDYKSAAEFLEKTKTNYQKENNNDLIASTMIKLGYQDWGLVILK